MFGLMPLMFTQLPGGAIAEGPATWDPFWNWQANADTTIDVGVKYWAESVSSARLEQLTGTSQPTLSLADADWSGQDALAFDTGDRMTLNETDVPKSAQAFLHNGLQSWYALILWMPTSAGNALLLDTSNLGGGTGIYVEARAAGAFFRTYNAGAVVATANDTTGTIAVGVPGFIEVYMNSAVATIGAATNGGAFATGAMTSPSLADPSVSMRLAISAVAGETPHVFFSQTIPDVARRAEIHAYLARYGL